MSMLLTSVVCKCQGLGGYRGIFQGGGAGMEGRLEAVCVLDLQPAQSGLPPLLAKVVHIPLSQSVGE